MSHHQLRLSCKWGARSLINESAVWLQSRRQNSKCRWDFFLPLLDNSSTSNTAHGKSQKEVCKVAAAKTADVEAEAATFINVGPLLRLCVREGKVRLHTLRLHNDQNRFLGRLQLPDTAIRQFISTDDSACTTSVQEMCVKHSTCTHAHTHAYMQKQVEEWDFYITF